jgi:hypothetical protein
MESQQPENCENRNGPDLVQAFLKKWWVELVKLTVYKQFLVNFDRIIILYINFCKT